MGEPGLDVIRFGVDLAIGLLALEAFVLALNRRRTGGGLPYLTIALVAAAGIALLLALRLVLAGGPAVLIGAMLALGGVFHAADLAWRLRHPDRG